MIYLRKSSNDLISHCKCEHAIASYPAQLDCPWCGCGWLFSCMKCRKAFTFAEAFEIETTWEELAQMDIYNHSKEKATNEDISDWVQDMKGILHKIKMDSRYSLLDGEVIDVQATLIDYEGWHAYHAFESNPHIKALSDNSVIENTFTNREYWEANRV